MIKRKEVVLKKSI